MTRPSQTIQSAENPSVSRPTVNVAIVMTIAWFAIVAIAITASANLKSASAYGIDEVLTNIQVASR